MSMLPSFAYPTTPSIETCLGKLAFANPTNGGGEGESDDRPDVVTVQATSEQSGGIDHDRKTRNPSHEWALWMNSTLDHCIELRLCKTVRSNDLLYLETQTYSCSRRVVVDGRSKKNKDNARARRSSSSNKRAGGCGCRVTIKMYRHVATVLGCVRACGARLAPLFSSCLGRV
ncbi:hypothetical protein BGW80DRAFT_1304507 [Lactifluus volemus]|nr:hypothetical protein BGW80DRAFT_1304507 [Lactifluus volemus]